jgi:hypothetical protein
MPGDARSGDIPIEFLYPDLRAREELLQAELRWRYVLDPRTKDALVLHGTVVLENDPCGKRGQPQLTETRTRKN